MIFVALAEAADRGQLLLCEGGLCRWHRRRDQTVTIRELIVLPTHRRRGIGRNLVERVARLNPGCPLSARCPVCYPANAFWRAVGFDLADTVKGANVWIRPASCIAPAAIPPSPAPPSS
jgi:GNAT superfamily N-acetyltransferase